MSAFDVGISLNLEGCSERGIALLGFCCFLRSGYVSYCVAEELFAHHGRPRTEVLDVLNELDQLGLIADARVHDYFWIHESVQYSVRQSLSPEIQQHWWARAVCCLHRLMTVEEANVRVDLDQTLPHAVALLEQSGLYQHPQSEHGELLAVTCRRLSDWGLTWKARELVAICRPADNSMLFSV